MEISMWVVVPGTAGQHQSDHHFTVCGSHCVYRKQLLGWRGSAILRAGIPSIAREHCDTHHIVQGTFVSIVPGVWVVG